MNKLFSQLIAIFGLMMMFAVSGWGASFTIDDVSIAEGDSGTTNMTFTVTINSYCRKNTTYTVDWATANNTATAGSDYTASSGTVSYTQGGSNDSSGACGTRTFTVPIISDGSVEGDEQFYVNLTNPTTSNSLYPADITNSQSIGTINNDDLPPVMGNVPNQTATVGASFSLNIVSYVILTNSDPITAYTLTGTLPAGLSFNTATGIISGTPTTVTASTSFTITATDNDGISNSDSFTITVNPTSADLAMTKTATGSVQTNNTITYTLSVRNNGPSNTNNITATDVLPASVTYQTAYGADWICSYTIATRTVTCLHPTDLNNGAIAPDITIVTVAPSTAQTVTNSAHVTSSLSDSNSGNNTSSASTTVTNAVYTSSNERPFTLQKQYNINGSMKIIGNSMLLKSDGTCATTSTDNNDIATTWADRDGDASTWNSSSADLVLPKGVDSSKIKYAGLYWQGRVDSDHDDSTFWANAKTIKFKGQGLSYQTLTSSDSKYNWTIRSSRDSNYQGIVDVTAIVKQSIDTVPIATIDSTGFSGTFFGANVQAQKMSNGFGAWALVVIYEDYADTLKNISLYDGYISVDDGETIPTTLSGFLTPTSGTVDSHFMVFAGEGDVTLTDSVTMSNAFGDQSLGSNVFNSSETIDGVQVTNRNPSCQNTIGIDIDSFNVGTNSPTTPIIKNGQISTIVKLKSTGDVYYPGVFAFSTQLYIPDVCYLEDVTLNGSLIGVGNEPTTGDTVEYLVSISNKSNETAKGVFVEKQFNKPGEITYVPGSMSIAPIPGTTFSVKTDTIGDDTAEYNSDTNMTKYLLGTGATWYEGGSLVKDAVTKFKYQAQVGDQNASENVYLVSYRNDLLNITFSGVPIRKCSDFNNSFAVSASGDYQVVDAGQSCGGQMFTKVVNQGYNVDMVSCDGSNNLVAPSTTKTIDITYSDASKNPIGGAPAITSISFPGGQNRVSNVPIAAYDKATKSINLATKRSDEATWSSISNSFAVRPKNFNIVSTPAAGSKIKAGQNFALEFQGLDVAGNNAQNYSDTADINFAVTVADQQPSCLTGVFNPDIKTGWGFADGTRTLSTSYPEVGIVNITATETSKPCGQRFASVDCTDSDVSNLNIEDGTTALTFIPDHFSVAGTLNDKGNGFTYLSADLKMSADLNITLTAQNQANGTTHNYNAACYAKNIDINVSYNAPVINPANGVTQLLYRETQTNTNGINNPIGTLMLINTLSPANIFTQALAGVGYPDIKFNFNRSQTIPVNPFAFTVNVINIRDVDSVTGTQNLNSNATFAYGRFVPRDIRVFGQNPFTAIGWYEVFNSPTLGATLLTPSKNENMWYINRLHDDATGGDANVSAVATATNTGGLPLSPVSNGTGIETYQFAGETPPYSAKAHIAVSPWLWYGPAALTYTTPGTDCSTHPCFNINVVPSVGATGSSKDQGVGSKSNKSTSGGTGWKSTRDYAPAIR